MRLSACFEIGSLVIEVEAGKCFSPHINCESCLGTLAGLHKTWIHTGAIQELRVLLLLRCKVLYYSLCNQLSTVYLWALLRSVVILVVSR